MEELFDLQETTAKIRKRNRSLKAAKIGIKIYSNGPGEMADADYGYVGTIQKITLSKRKLLWKKT